MCLGLGECSGSIFASRSVHPISTFVYIRVLFPELIFGEVLPYVECTKINAFPIHICCLTFHFV